MSDSTVLLNEENLKWRQTAREIANEYVRPVAAEYDRKQEYPWEVTKKFAEAGLLTTWIPVETQFVSQGAETAFEIMAVGSAQSVQFIRITSAGQ